MPQLTFLGAAGTVTGSKYLVQANGKRLLVDCGLFQGGKELRQRNWTPLPQVPATIDWVVLTHAHIDHTGYVPRLVRDGFRGPVFADAATKELCALLLPDSAHLMEEDAADAGKKGRSSHKPPLPLYTQDQALAALERFREIPRLGEYRISPEFLVRAHYAGHIVGACSLEIDDHRGQSENHRAFFGRPGPLRPADSERPREAAARRRGALRIHLWRSRASFGSARGASPGRRHQSRRQARRRRSWCRPLPSTARNC